MAMRLLTAVLLAPATGLAHAQAYPARPVRLIIPVAGQVQMNIGSAVQNIPHGE